VGARLDAFGLSRCTNPEERGSKVEQSVCDKILERAEVGKRKYGVTMERTDLTRLDWLKHAQEEALDMAVYLQKLIDIELINNKSK
jgi:hypothetical protein